MLAADVTSFSAVVNLIGSVSVLMPFELPALITNSYVKSSLRPLIFMDVSFVSFFSGGLLLPMRLQNTLKTKIVTFYVKCITCPAVVKILKPFYLIDTIYKVFHLIMRFSVEYLLLYYYYQLTCIIWF